MYLFVNSLTQQNYFLQDNYLILGVSASFLSFFLFRLFRSINNSLRKSEGDMIYLTEGEALLFLIAVAIVAGLIELVKYLASTVNIWLPILGIVVAIGTFVYFVFLSKWGRSFWKRQRIKRTIKGKQTLIEEKRNEIQSKKEDIQRLEIRRKESPDPAFFTARIEPLQADVYNLEKEIGRIESEISTLRRTLL